MMGTIEMKPVPLHRDEISAGTTCLIHGSGDAFVEEPVHKVCSI